MIVSTQLSDFHTIVITVLKIKYKKYPQKKKDYKSFDRVKFKTELNPELNENVSNCHSFENKFIEVQNKHTSYTIYDEIKAIMQRSQLRTKYLKN